MSLLVYDTSILSTSPPYSPPLSPCHDEVPVISTDDLGMVADDEQLPAKTDHAVQQVKQKAPRKERPPRKYVSKHFTTRATRSALETDEENADASHNIPGESLKPKQELLHVAAGFDTPPATPAIPTPTAHIVHGLNIDELSSDSPLTDVPSDIGPDPFSSSDEQPSKVVAIKAKRKHSTKSPYFPHRHRPRANFISAVLPFPPLSAPVFGLMQERLSADPFRLLLATIFLNKTPGERAMPVFYQLMEQYPTPSALADAQVEDVTGIIRHLGFQNQRARKCVAMAKAWVARAPERGKRVRKMNYPVKGDGKDVRVDEMLDDEDARVAWEISHVPGLGPYSHDSWRIFCRDTLRFPSLAPEPKGRYTPFPTTPSFEPEWKRVLPTDKELRAYLTWMWLKEGWVWNKETGERKKADDALMARARGGGIVVEERENNVLSVQGVNETEVEQKIEIGKVEKPAGDFVPLDM